MNPIDLVCRLAAASPVAALLISVLMLAAVLGVARALEACEW